MRIALLSVSSEMGGSEVVLLDLVRGLRRLAPSWETALVVPREGPLAARGREAGAAVWILPMPPALARLGESGGDIRQRGVTLLTAAGAVGGYVKRLRRALREIAPDVVHTNGFKMHVAGARAVAPGTPLVWHVHEYVTPRALSRRLLWANASRTAAILANSASVAADVRAALGGRVQVFTIHNAVDLREFSPHGDRTDLAGVAGMPEPRPGSVTVGMVATFGRWKGHDTFLQAIARVLPAVPHLRAYVIGGSLYDTEGSQRSLDELRALARSLGIAERVGFTGFIDRPAPAFRALDVVVHASTQPEPFGLVIAEAMACGRALVTSGTGGAAELVTDGVDALTHAPGDVAGLAAAIERLAADAALRARLGAAARSRAESHLDPDGFTRAFIRVYSMVARAAEVSA